MGAKRLARKMLKMPRFFNHGWTPMNTDFEQEKTEKQERRKTADEEGIEPPINAKRRWTEESKKWGQKD